MKKVTNNGNVGVTIVGSDGEARTVRAGETKSVSYDAKHPANVALERQRAITVGGETTASSAPRKAAPRRSAAKKAATKTTSPAPATETSSS
jgi:ATP sulfurylase